MIQRVYERVKEAAFLTDVVVATDDERIYACVEGFGGRVLMTAPTHRSGSDRVAEAAQELGLEDEDIVINVQGDQPALDPQCLPEVVLPFTENPEVVMATLVHRIHDLAEIEDPNNVKCVFDKEYFALYFSRSPLPFDRDGSSSLDVFKHIGIYAYRKHFLDKFTSLPQGRLEAIEKLEQLRVIEHGFRIKVVETTHESKEVDIPEDVHKLEAVLKK
jgi:3-deoxy-manno-octulosonate cytidylyltransferase (CMP-KDO synthetase)